MSARPLFIVAGIGTGTGTGAATARLFAKTGYRVALIARNADQLNHVAGEINDAGGEAAAFPVQGYTYSSMTSIFDTISAHAWPTPAPSELRVALWNVGVVAFGTFLTITEADIQASLEVHVTAGFAFSRRVVLALKENALDEHGSRGTLIFTGATASIRGNTFTSAFAAGKHGIRALSQSLAKEFGKDNIHNATKLMHALNRSRTIIDGVILTNLSLSRRPDDAKEAWKADPDIRLDSESVAKSYLYLTQQDRSAWTWELDLRPSHEKW